MFFYKLFNFSCQENYTNRAATFDILGERATAPVVCEFGSVPTTRRDLPQRNLSQSSLYNSQTGTGSLLDDNSVCNDPRVNVSTQVSFLPYLLIGHPVDI